MTTTQTVLHGKDTVNQGDLYTSFELGDKSWKLTLAQNAEKSARTNDRSRIEIPMPSRIYGRRRLPMWQQISHPEVSVKTAWPAWVDIGELGLQAGPSPHERPITAMVVKGASPMTVHSYRSRLMTKLGVHDVPALVRFATHCGVIDADGNCVFVQVRSRTPYRRETHTVFTVSTCTGTNTPRRVRMRFTFCRTMTACPRSRSQAESRCRTRGRFR